MSHLTGLPWVILTASIHSAYMCSHRHVYVCVCMCTCSYRHNTTHGYWSEVTFGSWFSYYVKPGNLIQVLKSVTIMEKIICFSIMIDRFAGYSCLGWHLWSLKTCKNIIPGSSGLQCLHWKVMYHSKGIGFISDSVHLSYGFQYSSLLFCISNDFISMWCEKLIL